jgi:hypothetical protein
MSIQERSSVEAMKQALEALESAERFRPGVPIAQRAITALRQAIHATELREQAEVRSTEEQAQLDSRPGLALKLAMAEENEKRLDALKAEQAQPVAMYEDWYDSNSCGHCGMVGGHTKSCRHYTAPPRQPLTDREVELLDGMIEVQLNHAQRCDSIANRPMAEKQKGWDMERVELLRKLRAAHGIYAPTGLKGEA